MESGLLTKSEVFEMKFVMNASTEELLERGSYDLVFNTNIICRANTRPHLPNSILKMQFIVLEGDPSIEEINHAFLKEGLRRPRVEDALLFGATFPEEQCKRRLVFFCRELSKKESSTRAIILNGIRDELRGRIKRAISVRDTGLGSDEAYVGVCFE